MKNAYKYLKTFYVLKFKLLLNFKRLYLRLK